MSVKRYVRIFFPSVVFPFIFLVDNVKIPNILTSPCKNKYANWCTYNERRTFWRHGMNITDTANTRYDNGHVSLWRQFSWSRLALLHCMFRDGNYVTLVQWCQPYQWTTNRRTNPSTSEGVWMIMAGIKSLGNFYGFHQIPWEFLRFSSNPLVLTYIWAALTIYQHHHYHHQK